MKYLTALLLTIMTFQSPWASLPGQGGRELQTGKSVDSLSTSSIAGLFTSNQPLEVNILLDASGSMGMDLQLLAIQTAESILARLRPADTFTLKAFSGSSESIADTARSADLARSASTHTWLHKRHTSGGIELPGAVRTILAGATESERMRVIIIITDGRIWGLEQAFCLIRKSAPSTVVIACNIGSRSSPQLLAGVAQCPRGIGLRIRHDGEILPQISDAGIVNPAAILSSNSSDIHFTTIQNSQGGLR